MSGDDHDQEESTTFWFISRVVAGALLLAALLEFWPPAFLR